MMKATNWITLAALIGTCSFAAAQDEKPARPERNRAVSAEVLKKYDKDGDGKLSDEERKTMRDELQAEQLKKYDKDGDGKLSQEERQAMQADREAKRKEFLEKYDADKDGKLSPEEIKAARDAGAEIPMGGVRGQGGGRRGGPEGKADAPAAPKEG